MISKVRETIRRYGMFQAGDRVVVAVSGGSDSVALLGVLKKINAELCLKIFVAHFDHGLRKASRRDRLFVEDLASSFGFPFLGGVMPKKILSENGSLEDRMRKARYGFLADACRRVKAATLVVGHTSDDQAETVLMRVLRGTGLYGLSAILPRRRMGDVELVRPLIEVTRAQVMRFLKKEGLSFRRDETNIDERFLRNKIRRRLLPYLRRRYNPRISQNLSGLALTVGADYEFLAGEAAAFFKRFGSVGPDACAVPLGKFMALPQALRRMVLRCLLERLKGDLRRITFAHWREAEEMLLERPVGARVNLPCGLCVEKTRHALRVARTQKGRKDILLLRRVPL